MHFLQNFSYTSPRYNYLFVRIFSRCVCMIFFCVQSLESSLNFATRFDSNSTHTTHVLSNILNCIQLSLPCKVLNPFAARSTAVARLLGFRFRIPPESIYICLLWLPCVLSGSGLCDGLITCPQESYRLWCVYDRATSIMRKPLPTGRLSGQEKFKMPKHNSEYKDNSDKWSILVTVWT